MKKKVLFLLPYPLHKAPSQRFRVEAYFELLAAQGIEYSVDTFLNEGAWNILYKKGSALPKAIAVFKGICLRICKVLFIAPKYDYVFVHREALPIGPPIFEFFIAKVLKKKMIYDFDDAIWIPNTTKENKVVNRVKAFWKVKYICKWSYKIAAGNSFLLDYASKFNESVCLVPTCVDVLHKHNLLKDQQTERVVVGWTGSHSTMIYLEKIVPVLKKVVEEFDVDIIIISNKAPRFQLNHMKYLPWNEKSEILDLSQINIGIMPLEDDVWSEGKCGFKLIQYLALGIPAVASPVGVNKEIVDQQNGFLCSTESDWFEALDKLINNVSLRQAMGRRGREKIINRYSVQANEGAFLELFN